MSTNLKLELEAYKSLADVLERAEKTRQLFEQARVPLPDTLQRLMRSNGQGPQIHLAATLLKPPAPLEAEPDWIWIDIKNATPGTVALALLKESTEALTAKDIHAKMLAMEIDVSLGTIMNTGTRAIENGWIKRSESGQWELLQRDRGGIIKDSYIWGPPSVFQMQEQASFRRNAIIHLLRQNPVGLQVMQIVVQLRQTDLVRQPIPVSKSLVKVDMEVLENDGRARRRGNSKKWEAI